MAGPDPSDTRVSPCVGQTWPRVLLASRSPRRRQLLEDAGIPYDVIQNRIDDGDLVPGEAHPRAWAVSLAYLKASAACRVVEEDHPDLLMPDDPEAVGPVVLGADTICIIGGEVIGQPASAAAARTVLAQISGGRHEVITGVALVDPVTYERDLFCESAVVEVGPLDPAEIDRYIDSDEWRGKAGGYNLIERQNAGWPVTCHGDAATVMGLPISRLVEHLSGFHSFREGRVIDPCSEVSRAS